MGSLHRIKLGDVTPHNIKQLKRLNQVIFPVNYNDKFCKDVLEKNLKVPSGQNADVQKTDN
uniref:NAA50 n=1 Tax=Aotus nancymaae TaxID=37293 RepID=A0A2K5EBD6_AOTNA